METQTVTIEVAVSTAAILRALEEKANTHGESLDALLRRLVENGEAYRAEAWKATANGEGAEALLDVAYIAECAANADPSITIAGVREALSKIPGSMSEEVSRERDER